MSDAVPAPVPRPRLPKAIRLQGWTLVTLLGLFVLPIFFGMWADQEAAYGVQVDRALQGPSAELWFGTDSLGRSQWDRTLIGTAISLRVVGGALLLALPLSLVMGILAGWHHNRWPDHAIKWCIAILHTIPFFLLVVAAAAVIGPGTSALPWLIGAVIWAPAARLVRIETIRIIEGSYVKAGRAYGLSSLSLCLRSAFPLTLPPAAVCLFYLFPEIIGIDAILSLFGLGPKPPTPSLGGLVFDGVRRWDAAPWLAGLPCLFLLAICLGMHYLADKIASQLNSLK